MKKYEAYKPSGIVWIGDVPKRWQIIPFKYCVDINNGADYKDVETDDEDAYPVVGSGGVFAYASKYMYDGEVIFLGRKGTVDKPLYFNGKFWAIDTMFYAIPKKKNNGKFLYYQSLTFPFDYYLTNTARPSMTQTDLGDNKICLPPLAEQTAIVNYLDAKCAKIDNVVSVQKKRIELLKELKQSIITKAVTKGLDKNAKMKDSGIEWIGEVPERWEIIPFKHCVQINNGADYKDVETDDEDAYPVIGSGGDFAFATKYMYDGEVIFLGRKGTVDKPLYFKGKFWAIDTMFYAIPKKKNNGKYLYYQSLTFPFDYYLTNTARPSMTQTDLGDNKICRPPLSEQSAIVEYLDKKCATIDKQIAKVEKQIELLYEYKQSVITECVTGKRKVC